MNLKALISIRLEDGADFMVTQNEKFYYVELGPSYETVRLKDLKLIVEKLTALVAKEERS